MIHLVTTQVVTFFFGLDMTTTCAECGDDCHLVTGLDIYPHREDLYKKSFWHCNSCDAYVGCHPNSTNPLGTAAGPALRPMRSQCHKVFDPMWKNKTKFKNRSEAYSWISKKMGFEVHFSQLTHPQCVKALSLLLEHRGDD